MELTAYQMRMLKKHSVHHTKKHINFMIKEMKKGLSFKKAHLLAMSKVGT
jgi:hypothetical protein